MSRSTADIAALNAELTNDPNSLGLTAPPTVDDVPNAEKLNEVLDTQKVDRKAIPVNEIAQNIDRAQFNALSIADRQWLQMIMQTGSVDVNDAGQVKQGLNQMFPEGETHNALIGLLEESVNRVEQMYRQGLLETGGTVTPSDISDARQYTP
jgi:hypothetical protein